MIKEKQWQNASYVQKCSVFSGIFQKTTSFKTLLKVGLDFNINNVFEVYRYAFAQKVYCTWCDFSPLHFTVGQWQFLIFIIYIHKRVRPLTHWLTDSLTDWLTHSLTHWLNTALVILWKIRSRILVYRLVLRPWPPLRRGFAKFRPLPPRGGQTSKTRFWT